MKSAQIKAWIRVVVFLVVLTLVLGYTDRVFRFKYDEGIYEWKKYYQLEPDSVDVLFLGNSHNFTAINTATLWEDYGMASFVLGGPVQPMWTTYYYLKEALKTQRPKVIVLEAYSTVLNVEYLGDSGIAMNSFGMHWSRDKVRSIPVVAPEEEQSAFYLEYSQYHTRYTELGRSDFVEDKGDPLYGSWKGFICYMHTKPLRRSDVSGVTGRAEPLEKTDKYFRKVLELAKEEGIPILVTVHPYAGITESDQEIFNYVQDVTQEMGVPFINFNLEEEPIGIDYQRDFADEGHFNHRGNRKFSRYFGAILQERYDIPDHRGDSRYDSWEENAALTGRMIGNQEIREEESLAGIGERLSGRGCWTVVSISDSRILEQPEVLAFVRGLGIMEDAEGLWFVRGDAVEWNGEMDGGTMYLSTPGHDFCLRRGDAEVPNSLLADREEVLPGGEGLSAVIYDPVMDAVVDRFCVEKDGAPVLSRPE